MRGSISKKNTLRLLLLLSVVATLLLVTLPGGAQTTNLSTSCTATNGSYSCSVTIPAGTSPGRYDLVATCNAGGTSSYPISSNNGSLTVSATTIPAGQSLTASGSGCANGSTAVTFSLVRTGNLALADVFSGVADAQTGTRTNRAAITVTAAGAGIPARAGGLSATGVDVMPWLISGIAALAVGGAFVVAGRRRIRKTPSVSA